MYVREAEAAAEPTVTTDDATATLSRLLGPHTVTLDSVSAARY